MTATGRLRPTAPAPEATKASALAEALGGRQHVSVVVPRTQVSGQMRLLGRGESSDVTFAARKHFQDRGVELTPSAMATPGVMDEWNCEVAVRHLAIAVRDPADVSRPLASLEEWRQCDDDQIAALWQEYQDLRERLDPLAALGELPEAEFTAIAQAVKKKDADLLRSYGCSKLAAYAITTGGPPAS